MPTYTFKCTKCEKEIDKKLAVNDRNEPQTCDCGEPMERTVSHTSPPIFNGSDFTPRFHK